MLSRPRIKPHLISFTDSTVFPATLHSGPFKKSGKRQFSSLIDATFFSRTCKHLPTLMTAPERSQDLYVWCFSWGKVLKQLSFTLKEFCSFLKGCEYLDAACLGVANVYKVVEFRANTRGFKTPAICCKSIIIPWNAISSENLNKPYELRLQGVKLTPGLLIKPVYNTNKY